MPITTAIRLRNLAVLLIAALAIPIPARGILKLAWFYCMVRNKAPWDYKQLGSRYTKFGNFNFGLTGAAAGIPLDVLQRGAGWAQQRAGTSKPEWGTPFGAAGMSYTCGDDPDDQVYINLGYHAYAEDFAPKP